jgi:hypothetical protein
VRYRRGTMHLTRRPRATGAGLALVCFLALLGPGAAGRAAAVADATGSLVAGPAAGPGPGLLQDRPGRALVAPGGTRDDRERPGPALPGVLALAVAAAWTVLAAGRAARPGGGGAAASGARAPPPLQPAAR